MTRRAPKNYPPIMQSSRLLAAGRHPRAWARRLAASSSGLCQTVLTPPTSCGGHGTLLAANCTCNCNDGYYNDFTVGQWA
jgi:hypothetical protein